MEIDLTVSKRTSQKIDHKAEKLAEHPRRSIFLRISALTIGQIESPIMTSWKTHLVLGEGEITQKGFDKNPNKMTQRIFRRF